MSACAGEPSLELLIVEQVLALQLGHAQREVLRQMHFVRTIDTKRREIRIRLPRFIDIPSRQLLKNRALEEYAVRWNRAH